MVLFNITMMPKEINENTALNFKNVCVNFYKNSIRQTNKKIINESEFNKIEELNFEVFTKKSEYEEYLEIADVYTYAKMKGTHEEVVTVKGEWKSCATIKRNVSINGRKFYYEYTIIGKNAEELKVGPITIDFLNAKIRFELEGTPKTRIKDLEFIISVLKEKYIMFDDVKFDLPFNDVEIINKNIDIYSKQLEYFKKIIKFYAVLIYY